MVLFYEGEPKNKQICLLFHNGHCSVIRSITQFMNRSYYCHQCNVGYCNRIEHRFVFCKANLFVKRFFNSKIFRCKAVCQHCYNDGGECEYTGWSTCDECHRYFSSEFCYANHLKNENGKSVCEQARF